MSEITEETLARGSWLRRLPLLVVGGAASFDASDGAMVVTSGLVTVGVDTPPQDARIDLDNDGAYDFGIAMTEGLGPDGAGRDIWVTMDAFGADRDFAFASAAAVTGGDPTALSAGGTVGSSLYFGGGIEWLAASSGLVFNGLGNWFGGNDAFVGLKFGPAGSQVFGWVHVIWDPDAEVVILDQWGYEDSGSAAVIPMVSADPPIGSVGFGDILEPQQGRVKLVWPVHTGYTYELQRADVLSPGSWTTIHTVSPTADGEASFLDDEFEGSPKTHCFYRVQRSSVPLVLLAMGRRRKWKRS